MIVNGVILQVLSQTDSVKLAQLKTVQNSSFSVDHADLTDNRDLTAQELQTDLMASPSS